MELQRKPKIREHEANTNPKHPLVASASSSPAHEFSFAVSLQSSSTAYLDKATGSHQPPPAIDLTPADEIFFHGHLLPLHLLPNLPVSPRSSTNSLYGSTLLDQGIHNKIDGCICSSCDQTRGHSFNSYEYSARRIREHLNNIEELPSKGRTKAKSFSFFGLARRRKEGEIQQGEREEDQGDKAHKKKPRFDMSHFLKRYTRMFSKGRTEDIQFRKQPYSFSGKRSPSSGRRDLVGMRGEVSAPASMRTSPTNSGVVSATSRAPSPPSNDSTMEELQAAIQAAIAHCKDSISAPEKLKS